MTRHFCFDCLKDVVTNDAHICRVRGHDWEMREVLKQQVEQFLFKPPILEYFTLEQIRNNYLDVVSPQPPPADEGEEVLPYVLEFLEARSDAGVAKYGQPLRTDDGRDGLVDLAQELGDALMYVMKEIRRKQHATR